MGIIYGKPGKIIYVKPKQGWLHKRERFVKAGGHLEYFGKRPECSDMPEDLISVLIEEENFKTGDHAVLNKLQVQLALKLDVNADDERLRNSISVFEEGIPDTWLQNRLGCQLLSRLGGYPLFAILDDIDSKNCENNGEEIQGFADGSEKLSKVLEYWVKTETEDIGFVVMEDSCRILYGDLPRREALDPANPGHQSMIAYMNRYEARKNELLKKERAYKEEEHAHKQAIQAMEYECEQALRNKELAHKHAIRAMEYAHQQTIKEMEASVREKEYAYDQTIRELEVVYERSVKEKEYEYEQGVREMTTAYELAVKKAECAKVKKLYEFEIKKENEKADSEKRLADIAEKTRDARMRRLALESEPEAELTRLEQGPNPVRDGEKIVEGAEKDDPPAISREETHSSDHARRKNTEKKQGASHRTKKKKKSILPKLAFAALISVSLFFLVGGVLHLPVGAHFYIAS